MPEQLRWFRRPRGRYHAAPDHWERTGRASCGADLAHPSHQWLGTNPLGWVDAPQLARVCAHCLRIETKLRRDQLP